ncbi:hypothetical protein GCM10009715_39410 [Paeniglutamicibacter psychrophenolicus]
MKLVITDAHTGLKKAIATAFQGAAWQRCRVHFMRNVLANVPKGSGGNGRLHHPHRLHPAHRAGGQ